MAKRSWLDAVRQRLAEHALPPTYVRRFMEELSDHFQDITEENMSTEASVLSRLGEPQQVADAAATAYQRRSFVGRHCWAAFALFGLSPLASLPLAFFGVTTVLVFLVTALDDDTFFRWVKAAGGATPLLYTASLLTVIVPSILITILYCALARRWGIGRRWIFLCCAVLACLAMLPVFSAILSETPGQSVLRCGLPRPQSVGQMFRFFSHTLPDNPRQLLQFLAPLAVGAWFMQKRHDRPRLQLRSM